MALEFQRRIRFEHFVLMLASAYDGYKFYLPAFMDFRGRIYRAGILHFHERDLAKSLIRFVGSEAPPQDEKEISRVLSCAAAFKYGKFSSFDAAYKWYTEVKKSVLTTPSGIIQYARDAFSVHSEMHCIKFEQGSHNTGCQC